MRNAKIKITYYVTCPHCKTIMEFQTYKERIIKCQLCEKTYKAVKTMQPRRRKK